MTVEMLEDVSNILSIVNESVTVCDVDHNAGKYSVYLYEIVFLVVTYGRGITI